MGFYAARGWTLWTGACFVPPTGVQRTTEDDGSLFVLPGRSLSTPPASSSATGAAATSGSRLGAVAGAET
jgi:hypothetical protein